MEMNEYDTSKMLPGDKDWPYAHGTEDAAAIHIRRTTREFRQKFKVWCLVNGYTMNGAVIALILMAIKEDIVLDRNIASCQNWEKP